MISTHPTSAALRRGDRDRNVTPGVQGLLQGVEAGPIPVATISGTQPPAGATEQAWQTGQPAGIESALAWVLG